MHRPRYLHAIARSSAMLLATLLTGNAYAEVFAPGVFSHEPQPAPTTKPAERNDLYNARLRPTAEEPERTSSIPLPSNRWISPPEKAEQPDEPSRPKLRF